MRTPHALLAALLLLCPPAALARQPSPPLSGGDGEGARTAIFALILGVNRSFDPGQPPLRFADDDAARYQDLFRLLGARTYLLTRLDENTRRLHPQAAAEAKAPTWSAWQAALAQLEQDLAQASSAGVETVLYVVYAGHGSVRNGQGYVSLEDRRLTGRELADGLLQRAGAARVHLIVDACSSYFLAYGRGAGSAASRASSASALMASPSRPAPSAPRPAAAAARRGRAPAAAPPPGAR